MTILFTNSEEFTHWRNSLNTNLSIGFVPTMGSLHAGHATLFTQAVNECDVVIASVYVNDLQFNSHLDFARYPRDLDADLIVCARSKIHALYAPTKTDIYNETDIDILDPDSSADNYEGVDRPGHFSGVITIVNRLLERVKPKFLYLGRKDFQQVVVIKKMTDHLHPSVSIRIANTVREDNGLAMSSRNRFLDERSLENAVCINEALLAMCKAWKSGEVSPQQLKAIALQQLEKLSGTVHYIEIVSQLTMNTSEIVQVGDNAIIAVSINGIRLIDNMEFTNGPG